jgi:hypothetical protein
MQNLHVEYPGSDLTYSKASLLAKRAAMENNMHSPVIIAWHQQSSHAMSPSYDGANPASWWEKYGAGNGGRMEVSVGNEFDFVLMDTRGFETVDQLPIRNLVAENGQEYICLSPMLGEGCAPIDKACVPLDEWTANQY